MCPNWGTLNSSLTCRRDGEWIRFNAGLAVSVAMAGLPGSGNMTFHSAWATWTDAGA